MLKMKQHLTSSVADSSLNLRRNARGYVLVEAMLVCIGIGFLAIASISLQETLTRSQSKVSVDTQLSEVRRMILENLNNPGVWNNLVENPENGIKACLASTTSKTFGECDYTNAKKISLDVSSGSRLRLDPSDETLGFDMNLTNCNGFGDDKISAAACPFRATMLWKPLCTILGDCQQAVIDVSIEADPRFESLYNFAAKTFSFAVKKNLALKRSIALPDSRQLSFIVNPAQPKKLEVYFIVDNSTSLRDNREMLGNGMATFVEAMKGMDVQYKVYTTESTALAASYAFPHEMLEGSENFDFAPGRYAMHDGTFMDTMFSWAPDKPATGSYKSWTSKMQLKKDFAEQSGLNLNQTHDQTDLTAIKTGLTQALVNAETVAGGSAEAGLCTLARILYDTGPNAPVAIGENALFVILSDEDDSSFQQYGSGHKVCMGDVGVLEKTTKDETVWCDSSKETCEGANLYIRYPYIEATVVARLSMGDSVYQTGDNVVCSSANGACGAAGATRACSAAELPTNGWTIDSCEVRNIYSLKEVYLPLYKTKSPGNVVPDLCSNRDASFKHDGTTFSNVRDFMQRAGDLAADQIPADLSTPSCDMSNFKSVNGVYPAFKILASDMPFTQSNGINQKFLAETQLLYQKIPSRLRELYGKKGYGLFSVIHDKPKDTTAGCTMDPSSGSYGTNYKSVQTASDTPGNLFSVCESDYSTSVKDMAIRAKQIVKDSFILEDFDSNLEMIYSVKIEREGNSIPVSASDYGLVGKSLQFRSGLVTAGDNILVVINAK